MIHQLLQSTLEDPKFIIEIGAHKGTDTEALHKNFPDTHIHSFEANPTLYNKYLKDLEDDKLTIINKAISEKNGEITFYVDENPIGDCGASSLLEAERNYLRTYVKKETPVQVQTLKLEDYMNDNNIDKVDLLWMDIEGYEYYVLKDIKNILNKFQYIYLEVNFQRFRKNMVLFNTLNKFMEENNFEIKFKESQGTPTWGEWQGNVLYINKNF